VIKIHVIRWSDCLSHRIFREIEKGWPDKWGTTIHFFWGLGHTNKAEIAECEAKGEEYWIIDTGYITTNITRYPKPDIVNIEKTHFRFCKGGMHNDMTDISTDDTRFKKLVKDDIWYATKLADYEQKEVPKDGHILITPSSNGVCTFMHGCSQDDWIKWVVPQCKRNTNKKLMFRNKPRPGNKWHNTRIEDALKGAAGLVTNMSMTAIDAIINNVPALVHEKHACKEIAETDFKNLDSLNTVSKEQLTTWMHKAANCQFTLDEIQRGEAYEYLR